MNNNSIVDLTISSPPSSVGQSSSNMYVHRPRSELPFDAPEGSRSLKRRRLDDSSVAGPSSHTPHQNHQPRISENDPNIESIDLTEVNDKSSLAKALLKRREDAAKSEHTSVDVGSRSALAAYKCPDTFSAINALSIRFDLARKERLMMDMGKHLVADVPSVGKHSLD
ncbi:hypothetical protein PAAG_02529 [Paracoccidioides lutzii Pb01]|uniref:Uncharacterized protein n=1 Tax=Paracoccidioides lutzii (strain ATCC MYA-826 / Pb01) TaxID=502779 RepID=C1GV56_PARBA|nr:hypothetical protein PAAG_02529 [Paracoccidioides lutzii Pb01]EEH40474.1 hypothetical protein PAAG_02529 [Paracoccidioides lutzii Pb01]